MINNDGRYFGFLVPFISGIGPGDSACLIGVPAGLTGVPAGDAAGEGTGLAGTTGVGVGFCGSGFGGSQAEVTAMAIARIDIDMNDLLILNFSCVRLCLDRIADSGRPRADILHSRMMRTSVFPQMHDQVTNLPPPHQHCAR